MLEEIFQRIMHCLAATDESNATRDPPYKATLVLVRLFAVKIIKIWIEKVFIVSINALQPPSKF